MPSYKVLSAHVLVVDDEASVREFLRDALEVIGYDVTVAHTAAGAIAAARVQQPNVILLDVGMPGGLTGDAAMPLLIRFAPVIIITGGDDDDLQRRLLAAGAFGYMRKPFDLRELMETVKSATAQTEVRAPRA